MKSPLLAESIEGLGLLSICSFLTSMATLDLLIFLCLSENRGKVKIINVLQVIPDGNKV